MLSRKFTIKSGKVIGRSHIFSGRNCQDSLRQSSVEVDGQTYIVGWISDGCSEGEHSEVGSNLATAFLLHQTIKYLNRHIDLGIIAYFLFEDLQQFLQANLESFQFLTPQEKSIYIKNFLLFTLVGFIIGPKHSVVLAYGDGLIIINDDIFKRDYNDESPYPGYLLIDPKYLSPNRRPINKEFDVYALETANIKKLAVGSDAWLQEFELVSLLWGQKHPNQVQRNMNLWSDEKKLADDASIIIVESIE